jgi:uncharacterized NAD(P)/FAD-binding protein YdhS
MNQALQGQRAPGLRRVVVAGGGFAGASVALQWLRARNGPIELVVIDPAERPGRGLAYATADADHRLNAPSFSHSLLADDITHFNRWCQAHGILQADPQALAANGAAYFRRWDFGRYIQHSLAEAAQPLADGSRVRHHQATAVDVSFGGTGPHGAVGAVGAVGAAGAAGAVGAEAPLYVHTAAGERIAADLLVLATGHPVPRWPAAVAGALASLDPAARKAAIAHPLGEPEALQAVPRDARVLLLGAGLTAFDVLSTLLRQGHMGPMRAVSRHGLLPTAHSPLPEPLATALVRSPGLEVLATLPPELMLDRIRAAPPEFVAHPGVPRSARGWLQAMRRRAKAAAAVGQGWHGPFDEVRDTLWQLWPRLPLPQQRRVMRQLKPFYDVHRYRSAPQNEALLAPALASGQLRFEAARLGALAFMPDGAWQVQLHRRGGTQESCRADVLINCTGLDPASGLSRNPLLAALVGRGLARLDDLGLGLAVGEHGRLLDSQGHAHPRLCAAGPPTAGHHAEAIGAMFIAAQIHRWVPGWQALVDASAAG